MEATVLGLGLYLGRVTSANIISGLDPQELDRPRLSAKTACPKLDALANAASFAINSSIGGRLLAADGLGVRVCRAGGSAAHTALEVFSETYGLCAPFGRRRLPIPAPCGGCLACAKKESLQHIRFPSGPPPEY